MTTLHQPFAHRDAAGVTQQQTFTTHYTMLDQGLMYSCCEYLYSCDDCSVNEYTAAINHKVTSDDWTKIVDWWCYIYIIINLCQLDRVNVLMAMNIVNRYMSNPHVNYPVLKSLYLSVAEKSCRIATCTSFVAVAALYITANNNEQEVIFSADNFAASSQRIYSVKNIETMEHLILYYLSLRVCAPTAFQVGYANLELMMSQVQEDSATAGEISWWEKSIQEELTFQNENTGFLVWLHVWHFGMPSIMFNM